ncbi:MAG: PHP domain-containing protein, partial [Bacteroidota bacterium]
MGLKADLHTHTIYSDGTLTPAELFDKAVERGIDALSITDHDTIDGCIEGAGIISDYDLEFVPGIELSCYENGKEYHLLGYEIDLDNKLFKKHLEFLRNARYKRAEKIHNGLKELGLVFPFEHILEKA